MRATLRAPNVAASVPRATSTISSNWVPLESAWSTIAPPARPRKRRAPDAPGPAAPLTSLVGAAVAEEVDSRHPRRHARGAWASFPSWRARPVPIPSAIYRDVVSLAMHAQLRPQRRSHPYLEGWGNLRAWLGQSSLRRGRA